MRVELLLKRRQAKAEKLMWGGCVASRPGIPFTDPDGIVTTPVETAYEGACKVQTTVAQAASPIAGGHVFTVENLQMHFPVATALETGDSVLMVTHRSDPTLIGRVFRLVELARGDQRTAARWNVELVTA
ncbi:DUF6093 family protein [Arthrobacter sp. GMC3]|uniref:DUF6093 family protein n=1 Tax=Arthrobacter sp. GMC3 TaxID=2058894 RepID=UPI000CE45DEB|nr:DUF6093 family protein [Arthrobacter sp. GMC3]